ncbi:MAG TPA: hypothetical protein VHE12_09440 [bacterium]|nr:hypothetical protein [bacterium]
MLLEPRTVATTETGTIVLLEMRSVAAMRTVTASEAGTVPWFAGTKRPTGLEVLSERPLIARPAHGGAGG